MSAPTHTPGPWRTGRSVFRTIYGQVDGVERLIGVMDRPEDATLASAAPEMLDTLRDVLDCVHALLPFDLTKLGGGVELASRLGSAHGRVLVAIAKAEGRAP